ncbi:VOC family protein, partial [Streptomyces sp. NPDC051644]|uniref:VOC family protein n=1 Tax=Streptomyces sp. NPDC051644 TaxID=3365666 RepID=UPI00379A81FB
MALGQWWATALGWVVVHSSDEEFEIRPEPDRLPGLDFVRLDESKKVKSRLHLDFRPDGSAAGLGDRFGHAARRAGVVMTVSYSTGVSRP